MAEKIAPGVTLDSGGVRDLEQQEAMDRAEEYREKRDDARWTIIVGVAMLFAGGISVYIAAGGAAMGAWGIAKYAYWSYRARAAYDPWKDPELEQWEDENYP